MCSTHAMRKFIIELTNMNTFCEHRLNRILVDRDHSAYQLQDHEAQLSTTKAGHNQYRHQIMPQATFHTLYHDQRLDKMHQVSNQIPNQSGN